ncbi:TLC domain-containing protein 4-B-like isoform X2 [Branchiostoma lanceolatum]|uniref:TLC domain-containing protein 4-B-like isoform X2 n=1 Tax=Branchiostoma lanceolatum TaxID=7740 RepID=UPI00345329DE
MNENVSIFLAGLASFVFSLSVFAAAPRVLSRLSKQYGRLSLEKSVQTDNEYNCLLLRHGVAGYLGYTIADVLMMMRHKSLFSKVFLVHHFVGTLCGLAGTMFTSVPWIMSTYLYYEASSPFVHLRFLLSNLGWKKTRLYTVNALLLMTVFFLCRVAIIPVYWRTVYLLYTDGSFPQIDAFVYYLMLYGRAFFDVLNVYWFSLMMKVFFEMFVWPNSASKKVN